MAETGNDGHVPSEPGQEFARAAPGPPPRSSGGTWIVWLVVGLLAVCFVMIMCCGILAALLLPAMRTGSEAARLALCRAHMTELDMMLQQYQLDMGEFPTTKQGLEALRNPPADLANPERWSGPYSDAEIPVDPWGDPYHYLCPGVSNADTYDLWSIGPDKKDGTEDDVGNWP